MEVRNDISLLGRNIVAWREAAALSRKELALRADVSELTLMHIERGSGNPTYKTLDKIARVLGVSVPELIEG